MMDIVESVEHRIESFLFRRSIRGGRAPWYKAYLFRFLRILYVAVQKFRLDDVFTRAHALTFITLLSIVPILALVFSVAKGFGMADNVWAALRESMTGVQPEILERIYTYVRNTNVGILGTLGLLTMVYSAITTVGSLEFAFNRIWQVPMQRSLFRKFTDYLSVLIVFPLLLLAATGLSASLRNVGLVATLMETQYVGYVIRSLLSLGSYFTLWIAFTFAYSFLPNTRVPVPQALLGGLFAGTLWNLVQHLYITFQIGVANYNAIYGTFASLPLFFIWIHISWLIILLGAEVAWVAGGRDSLEQLYGPRELCVSDAENLAVGVSMLLAERFHRGQPPLSSGSMAETLDIDETHVIRTLRSLLAANVVSMTVGQAPTYQPARSLETITLRDVIIAVRGEPTSLIVKADREWTSRVTPVLQKTWEKSIEALSRYTLLELVTGVALCPCKDPSQSNGGT